MRSGNFGSNENWHVTTMCFRAASDYAEQLLRTLQQYRPERFSLGVAMAQSDRLDQRVIAILDETRCRVPMSAWLARCCVLLAISITALLGAATCAPPSNMPPNSPAGDPNAEKDNSASRFSGRVIGLDGKPIEGASLYVVPEINRRLATAGPLRARTDKDGKFEFFATDMTVIDLDGQPAKRQCLLVAIADGHGFDWCRVRGNTRSSRIRRPIKGTGRVLHLPKDDVPIQGRLLDMDGKPVVGARVRLAELKIPKQYDLDATIEREKKMSVFASMDYHSTLYQLFPLPGLTIETKTDADGRFKKSGVGKDRIASLNVTGPTVIETHVPVMTRNVPDVTVRVGEGFLPVNQRQTQIIHGAKFSRKLKPCATVEGQVVDSETGEPIPGMWVGVGRPKFPRDGIVYRKNVTDAAGRFTVTGLQVGKPKPYLTAVSQPGMPYLSAGVQVEEDSPAVIKCQRGIPFRLKVTDEQGQLVRAEVTYNDVLPNPQAPRAMHNPCGTPLCRAARRADGTYEGFVVPGPGAVLVRAPNKKRYRPAFVDPKGFFAPGQTVWPVAIRRSTFGSANTLITSQGWMAQREYSAIVLINPAPDSGALELETILSDDIPRQVSLIDPEGNPIIGVQTEGLSTRRYQFEPLLRAATFPLTGLHPNYIRRIKFTEKERHLAGFLEARGDGLEPYTVQLQPWCALMGRIVDKQGRVVTDGSIQLLVGDNLESDEFAGSGSAVTDTEGRFRFDELVPGLRYHARVYRKRKLIGMACEGLVLRNGETRFLGDIQPMPAAAN
jgi:protocatechuate 3,4-dioxygenase beta subunit